MKTEQVKLAELRHATYNPRKISDADFEQIKTSLEQFGFVQPLVVNTYEGREGIIVGGNQRFEVAKKIGMEEVPVVYVNLDEAKERELNIRLNRNQGEWDFETLKTNFTEDELLDFGFQDFELDIFKDEEPPEEDTPPQTACRSACRCRCHLSAGETSTHVR